MIAASSAAISRLRREIAGYIAQVTVPHPGHGNENGDLYESTMITLDLCISLDEVAAGYEAQRQCMSEELQGLENL